MSAPGGIEALVRRAWPVVRQAGAAVRATLPDLRDLHVYGGGLLLAAGAWLAFEPAGPIALGALLLYLGLRRM